MTIRIVTDSCCDLPVEYIQENREIIDLVGMPIHIEGEDFLDDLGQQSDLSGFYDKIRKGSMASTSQITPVTFERIFKKNHQEGAATIYLGLSSGLSGTMNNALLAKNMILEVNENAQIYIPDIVSASVGQGVLVIYAVEMIKQGHSAETIVQWIESNKLNVQHWFAVDNLEYLKNGGRISQAVATIGTVLNIKPVLTVNNEGKLKLHQNIRGRKKSLKYLISRYEKYAAGSADAKILVGHGNCPKDAEQLVTLIGDKIGHENIIVTNLSYTIATHVGPDMLALAFVGKTREE